MHIPLISSDIAYPNPDLWFEISVAESYGLSPLHGCGIVESRRSRCDTRREAALN